AHDHVFRGFALDHTRHLTQFRLDDEAVAVLRHDVARISELCLLALALLGEFGLGVRGRAVRLIAPLLAVNMALAVAPRRWRVTRTVLRYKALHRCPSLNLRAVDGKVVVRKQGSHLPRARSSARNLRATSASSSRSRFFVNTVGTQTRSSTPRPT